MKKLLFVVLATLLVLCAALHCYAMEDYSETPAISEEDLGAAVEEEVQGWIEVILSITPKEWRGYVEEKIVPVVLLAVSAVITAVAFFLPVIKKIKGVAEIFEKAAEKLTDATKKSKEAREAANEAKDKLKEEGKALREEFAEVKNGYGEMRVSLANIESILRIAFGNTDELIRKGYANQIAKVGKEDVKEDEEA